jgi:hypothetical protein
VKEIRYQRKAVCEDILKQTGYVNRQLLPSYSRHYDDDYYSGRKITESLGNVTVRGEKWKGQGRNAMAKSLGMNSLPENICCSQLSSIAIRLQPGGNCFTSYSTRKGLGSLFSYAIALRSFLPPTCLLVKVIEARSYEYFASNILVSYVVSSTLYSYEYLLGNLFRIILFVGKNSAYV